MRNAGSIISTSELIDHAWDSNYEGFSNVVQTYIRYLRQKLTLPGEADIIETRRGAGSTVEPAATAVDTDTVQNEVEDGTNDGETADDTGTESGTESETEDTSDDINGVAVEDGTQD